MKKLTVLVFHLLILSSLTFVNISFGADMGHGHGMGKAGHPQFNANIGNIPPGLTNKGMPRGLAKQGKTPPGWDKGEKKGWDNDSARTTWDRFLDLFK